MPTQFPNRLAGNMDRFTGRVWLLPKLLDWWDNSNERIFLLTGAPGTGKSMFVAWLAGFGPGPQDPLGSEQLSRLRALVKAAHFCQDASRREITPKVFTENIASQLMGTVLGFSDALAATGAPWVQINVRVGAGAAGATVTGVRIDRIDLNPLGDEQSFDRSLIRPLQKLYASGYSGSMLLLVDALDEAIGYDGGMTIPDLLSRLADLPSPVRLLATTRDDPRALKLFRGVKPFDLIRDAAPEEDDVRDYILGRLKPLNAMSDMMRIQITDRLAKLAQGNFLIATTLLDELVARPPTVLSELDISPLSESLGGLYHNFLARELGKNERLWFDLYEPLLGLIAVAQGEGLTRQQLTDMIGKGMSDICAALRPCKQYLSGDLPDGPFRFFHTSFADFLLDNEENIDFHIEAKAMHRRIAEYYLKLVGN